MTLFDFIKEAETARRDKHEAIKRERKVLSPVLKDFTLIPELWESFNKHLPPKNNTVEENMHRRRVFMLLVIRLYSPKALAGYNLDGKTRKYLAEQVGCSKSSLSHSFRNLTFQFMAVRSFREEAEGVIYSVLSEKGISL